MSTSQTKIKTPNLEFNSMKIFSTPHGLNVVKSPIKSRILSALKENELSFDEIVKITGRSKSTVSAHLKVLTNDAILSSRPYPSDQRKKIFYINSKYIGELNQQERIEKEQEKIQFIIDNLSERGDPFEFFRLMFHTLRVVMMKEGINLDPILNQSGRKMGETFYDSLKADDTEQFIKNVCNFWEENGLGNMVLETTTPLTIKTYDCFECEYLPNVGETVCAFDAGIVEALFSAHFDREVDVEEILCYARGDECCCFVITKV